MPQGTPHAVNRICRKTGSITVPQAQQSGLSSFDRALGPLILRPTLALLSTLDLFVAAKSTTGCINTITVPVIDWFSDVINSHFDSRLVCVKLLRVLDV